MSGILEAIDLSKRFRRTVVLEHMNLSVPEGSIYGLVGPNGAGKTTTIKLLMNIHRPSGGRTEVFGGDSRDLRPSDFAEIGYVSENQELPGWMTVGHLMSYLKPFYPTWDDTRAADLLTQFDLPSDRKLRNLSRGMRMKAALASSLAYRPRLILLDEPFTGLDPLVRDELSSGFLENAENASILISSHDLNEIESFVSHIGYLDRGRLQFSDEMTALAGRFREIEITRDGGTGSPEPLPSAWMNVEESASVVRFVDTQFDQERTTADVRRIFGEPKQITINPMPLRSIFVTLAKSGRKGA